MSAPKLAEWLAQPARPQPSTGRRPEPPAPESPPAGGAQDPPARPPMRILDPAGRVERTFLVQCIALPRGPARALAQTDLSRT